VGTDQVQSVLAHGSSWVMTVVGMDCGQLRRPLEHTRQGRLRHLETKLAMHDMQGFTFTYCCVCVLAVAEHGWLMPRGGHTHAIQAA
jgi:hypothetical protein